MTRITNNLIVAGLFIITMQWAACDKMPVIYPQRKSIIETVYASGKIISGNEFKLAALCNGTIIKKMVGDGDSVQKGQLLYVVSNEAATEKYNAALKNYRNISANLSDVSPVLKDLKLSVQNAAMKCVNDSSTYFRYKNLWAQEIGTKSNLDNVYHNYQVSLNQKVIAEQKYNQALNDLRVLQSNAYSQVMDAGKYLQEYFIRSDRDGIVYQTFKEAGETVRTNEEVALIGEPGNQVIRLAVDQQDISKIRVGQRVLVQTDVTGSGIFDAEVSKIYSIMNEQDQTFRVDAVFTSQHASRFIHTSIEANIIVQHKVNALVLPRTALAGSDSVWVRGEAKKKKAKIQTGISTLEYVEITAGIDEKTPVLIFENEKP